MRNNNFCIIPISEDDWSDSYVYRDSVWEKVTKIYMDISKSVLNSYIEIQNILSEFELDLDVENQDLHIEGQLIKKVIFKILELPKSFQEATFIWAWDNFWKPVLISEPKYIEWETVNDLIEKSDDIEKDLIHDFMIKVFIYVIRDDVVKEWIEWFAFVLENIKYQVYWDWILWLVMTDISEEIVNIVSLNKNNYWDIKL